MAVESRITTQMRIACNDSSVLTTNCRSISDARRVLGLEVPDPSAHFVRQCACRLLAKKCLECGRIAAWHGHLHLGFFGRSVALEGPSLFDFEKTLFSAPNHLCVRRTAFRTASGRLLLGAHGGGIRASYTAGRTRWPPFE